MDVAREFSRLYAVEYGISTEVTFRFFAISFGILVLWIYADAPWALVWLGVFALLHAANFNLLRRVTAPRRPHLILACILFLSILTWFLTLLGFLILQNDTPMQICGLASLGCVMLWLVKRSDTPLFLIIGEIAVFAVMAGGCLALALPHITELSAQITTALCTCGVVIYFGMALFMARAQRLRTVEFQKRTTEAQKLEALGQLAGGVAHDFNNILTATIGNLELFREVPTQPEKEQCVEEALLAARSGDALARRLLSYSRRDDNEQEQTNLARTLFTLQTLGRRLVPAHINIFVCEVDPEAMLCVSEPDLTTALLNLMVNARDAMPGGGKLSVRAYSEQLEHARMMIDGKPIPAGQYMRIDVQDTGYGIRPELMNQILEPFFTTKLAGQGSGLGLPMVSEFARAAGGGLHLASSPDGTCATIYLPCAHRCQHAATAA